MDQIRPVTIGHMVICLHGLGRRLYKPTNRGNTFQARSFSIVGAAQSRYHVAPEEAQIIYRDN